MVTVTKPVSVEDYVIRQLDTTTTCKNSIFFFKITSFSEEFQGLKQHNLCQN